MSANEIIDINKNSDEIRRASLIMAIHCAPLIKCIKAANIITVSTRELLLIRQMLVETDISYYTLKLIPRSSTKKGRSDTKHILYLFRKRELLEYLSRDDVMDLLSDYGYESQLKDVLNLYFQILTYDSQTVDEQLENNIDLTILIYKLLKRLSDRIMMYCGGNLEFPHEIGAFLEYPVEDVRGFLENNGENFIYSGYWKVYHNASRTIKLFQFYDLVREHALREVMNGKSIKEIAV
ncbi:MAG: DUF3793 family protein [Lachnospiraceae bacterium]|nr:DUF3793 family protein [Lachnospiraceae bacterium]